MLQFNDKQLIQITTYVSIGVALTLVIGKAYAWYLTRSLSIQASLFDSLFDVFASLINSLAVYHALRPADAEHRFGHGKAEALASLGQSVIIALSALWLVKEAIGRFYSPEKILFTSVAIVVMIVSIAMTVLLVMLQRYVIGRTNSMAIAADSLHYQTDLFGNLAVLVSFCLATYGELYFFDSIAGLFIALYIIRTSWQIAAQAFDVLMDRELANDVLAKITEIVRAHPQILDMHDLRTRSSGQKEFIQMHLDLQEDISLKDAHDIAAEIEGKIMAAFPRAEVIIHQDPISIHQEKQ